MAKLTRPRILPPLLAIAAALALCPAVYAQNDLRIEAAPPPKQEKQAPPKPDKKAPVAMRIGADEDSLDADSVRDSAKGRAKDVKRDASGKLLNKDTAKNRRDLEMGTESTSGISIDKDENGDNVTGYTAPKKTAKAAPQQPVNIEVRPIVPLRR